MSPILKARDFNTSCKSIGRLLLHKPINEDFPMLRKFHDSPFVGFDGLNSRAV